MASSIQGTLPLSDVPVANTDGLGVTFRNSKRLPFHRWYAYVEGFSAAYIVQALKTFPNARSVYDPFGGAGTTLVEASGLGVTSGYSEVNPFMRFVVETKVNAAIGARQHPEPTALAFREFVSSLRSSEFKQYRNRLSLTAYDGAFPDRDFFEEEHIRTLVAARDYARNIAASSAVRDLLLLSVASNTVRSSNMTRRADLRRRRPDEYKNRVVNVAEFVAEHVQMMLEDLRLSSGPYVPTRCVGHDARARSDGTLDVFDIAVTSPPYLNGTNYFRNTKLELWLLGYLNSESDLRGFRNTAVTGGINDVNVHQPNVTQFAPVERVVAALEATDGDRRIPWLVRLYFSDMFDVLRAVRQRLKKGGHFLLDIGDSRFYGVHVPTDILLAHVATEAGFVVEGSQFLARRRSYDKTELKQVELILRQGK